MNIANIYRNLKLILNDSNIALINRGLNRVNNLDNILIEVNPDEVNRLPYLFNQSIKILYESDLNGVSRILNDIFGNCTALTSITIPYSVTYIESRAFEDCISLKHIYLKSTNPPTLAATFAFTNVLKTIHVPIGSGEAYKSATNWSSFAHKIVEDIEIEQE